MAYSPDGWNIISGSHDGTIQIWGAKGGTVVGEPLKATLVPQSYLLPTPPMGSTSFPDVEMRQFRFEVSELPLQLVSFYGGSLLM